MTPEQREHLIDTAGEARTELTPERLEEIAADAWGQIPYSNAYADLLPFFSTAISEATSPLRERIAALEGERDAAEEKVKMLAADIEETNKWAQGRVDAAVTSLKVVERGYTDAIDASRAAEADRDAANNGLKAVLERVAAWNEKDGKALVTAEAEVTRLKATLSSLREQVATLTSERDDARWKVDALDKERTSIITSLTAERDAACRERDACQKNWQETAARILDGVKPLTGEFLHEAVGRFVQDLRRRHHDVCRQRNEFMSSVSKAQTACEQWRGWMDETVSALLGRSGQFGYTPQTVAGEVVALRERAEKAEAFKKWVHDEYADRLQELVELRERRDEQRKGTT